MSDNPSWTARLSNRFFAVPLMAQAWGRLAARRTSGAPELAGAIPFHPLAKPLAECTVALITTGGVHRAGQPPFDMENPDGDASYREIPASSISADLTITHKYYDHRDADKDLNILFPLDHFRELAGRRVVGSLAPRHFGFMGHIEGQQLPRLTQVTAPEVADKLARDRVDCVFLTPA